MKLVKKFFVGFMSLAMVLSLFAAEAFADAEIIVNQTKTKDIISSDDAFIYDDNSGTGVLTDNLNMTAETDILDDVSTASANYALLQGYLDQEIKDALYGSQNVESDISLLGEDAGNNLTGYNKVVYSYLKAFVEKTSQGEHKVARVVIPVEAFGLSEDELDWSVSELGYSEVTLTSENAGKLMTAALNKAGFDKIDFQLVINALLQDCPYDLFWFDKSAGYQHGLPGGGYSYNEETGYITRFYLSGGVTVGFIVSADYRDQTASGDDAIYTLSSFPEVINTVKSNILSTITANKSKNDYEKLKAYLEKIKSMVSYNHDALNQGSAYYSKNPWQLIWVFDGDESTKVVCEGYSKAFQYLCDLTEFNSSRVRSRIVTGTMDGGTGAGSHMWNIVTMDDGKNYLVDVTNCDGDEGGLVSIGYPDKLFMAYKENASETPESGFEFSTKTGLSSPMTYKYDKDEKTNMFGIYTYDELDLSETAYDPSGAGTEDPAALTGLELSSPALSISKGQDTTLALTYIPANATDKNVKWESSNENIASVDQNGRVTGISAGTAVITVSSAADPRINASCSITITESVQKETPVITIKDKTAVYNGSVISIDPAEVSIAGLEISYVYYTDAACTKAASSHVNAGTYYVRATVAEDSNYTAAESNTAKLIISQAANKITNISPLTKKLAVKKLKKKKAAFSLTATVNNKASVTWQVNKYGSSKAKKYISVTKTGKVTVKKKTPKGTYKVTVTATSDGTGNFRSASLKKTIKIVVK